MKKDIKKIKIIIVDDHKLFRDGLKFLLSTFPNIDIIAEADDGVEFLKLLDVYIPDIVLMDISMPNMDGITATKEALKINPKIRVIAITMFSDEDYYYKMVHAGAVGFLLKKTGSNELIEAVNSVMDGNDYFSVDLLKSIIVTLGNKKQIYSEKNSIVKFSERELDVLKLICKGKSAKEIGGELNISSRTVEGHKQKLFDKTGTNNTSSLIMIGIKNDIIKI